MFKADKKRNPSTWWAIPVGLIMGAGWLSLAVYSIYSRIQPRD
ncbi:hypothetical protein [Desulfofundulus thermosubterraneus]|uniref:Uncharacterized protein n=1 Tax=Desulfofundulus thermosubterraneus DSM 16057 TaxID=1121432 RepID=A0A1M6L3S6_9FIRM|nr:hypothetical protein [Desulfofundulus thermosubterraneus]SHJ65840.1 hypothetical protein SAMN02745219_03041 [Desulfofundulus thermosubterraneus DSM 16057]